MGMTETPGGVSPFYQRPKGNAHTSKVSNGSVDKSNKRIYENYDYFCPENTDSTAEILSGANWRCWVFKGALHP